METNRYFTMTKRLNLQSGVLIIGSLLWQDHLNNDKKDNLRKKWRDTHLLLDQRIMVKVPIRYGRLSMSDIYTMTFSNSCARTKQGTGFFVPFKRSPTNLDDLMNEVKATSEAEGMKTRLLSRVSGTENIWSCMSLLTNPQNVNNQTKRLLNKYWKEEIAKEGTLDISQFRIGREKPCINKHGMLNINWLTPVDKRDTEKLNSYDLVIAAATKPTKYPSIKELSEKVNTDDKRYYFINNFKSGITTFQDNQILNKI